MEQYYIVMLAFLAVIAVIDLFVGVSNDASNFLNSALGCRIASFRTTMWVASLGVRHILFWHDGSGSFGHFPSSDVLLFGNHGGVFRRHGG